MNHKNDERANILMLTHDSQFGSASNKVNVCITNIALINAIFFAISTIFCNIYNLQFLAIFCDISNIALVNVAKAFVAKSTKSNSSTQLFGKDEKKRNTLTKPY